ncbi:alpha/beta hydrolase [Shinella sp. PSBB067]|uniref:alpha/beta hydrolase family protein n=1 Tax=Shinella sp. PSBB067 TaxID=2715959 RepID=UPI00193AE50E|nr:alpha/beta family hydrolase [Shinella sp. PSBB067]QRI64865.1 alpha/beta hydrolase [Shinella sp. PSBB067]
MSLPFLFTGPAGGRVTVLLAHGSGAPMDSPSMNAASLALAAEGLRVARFEFAYMAARRTQGSRRPPPKAETLNPEFCAAVAELRASGRLVIGGKSMGGRVASMVADGLYAEGRIAGLLCLGYPFHPPEKPAQLRTAHLMTLKVPTLICQGTRDPFGTSDEVPAYGLPARIDFLWLEDGDHDLKPRKTISGFSAADHLATMAKRVKAWTDTL